jgi:hypothetical protein
LSLKASKLSQRDQEPGIKKHNGMTIAFLLADERIVPGSSLSQSLGHPKILRHEFSQLAADEVDRLVCKKTLQQHRLKKGQKNIWKLSGCSWQQTLVPIVSDVQSNGHNTRLGILVVSES